jgi:hypothetical protein
MRKRQRETLRFAPDGPLARAALAGLLCLGAGACGSSSSKPEAVPQDPHITSSEVVGSLSADAFQALCDARDGTVEIMAHCGGLATARGFSYDIETQTLSEHTCKGANTCAGWNCVTDTPG